MVSNSTGLNRKYIWHISGSLITSSLTRLTKTPWSLRRAIQGRTQAFLFLVTLLERFRCCLWSNSNSSNFFRVVMDADMLLSVVFDSLYRQKVSLFNVSPMFCLPCALSRNSSLRDAKPAGYLFV